MTSAATPPAAKEATREAYGRALERLGHARADLVVLDADLSGSTKTNLFAKSFPERFFNMGVAEANMIGHAAGLALGGKLVFASSFAMFAAGKAWEQFRQSVCVPRLNVKVVASHAGITVGEDGASHQMLEDLALMRVLPHTTVVVPADGPQTETAVAAIAALDGPCYLRVSRASTPILAGTPPFELGRARVLREGGDLAILACGVEVPAALDAAEQLEADGVSCTILDCATVKPLDAAAVRAAAAQCGRVMTVEEHQVIGGLGEAVASALAQGGAPVPMRLHGMRGTFGQTGPADALLAHYRLDGPGIAAEARDFLSSLA